MNVSLRRLSIGKTVGSRFFCSENLADQPLPVCLWLYKQSEYDILQRSTRMGAERVNTRIYQNTEAFLETMIP